MTCTSGAVWIYFTRTFTHALQTDAVGGVAYRSCVDIGSSRFCSFCWFIGVVFGSVAVWYVECVDINVGHVQYTSTMKTFEIIADALIGLLNAVAWPVAIVVAVFLFRKELRQAFKRLSRLKYGDWEADFSRELDKAEKEAKSVALPQTVETGQSETVSPNIDHLLEVAGVSPQASILVAWPYVEEAIREASERLNLDIDERVSQYRMMERLIQAEAIAPEMKAIYNRLRHLRNEAAHYHDFEIGSAEAERYIQLIDRLIKYIKSVGQ